MSGSRISRRPYQYKQTVPETSDRHEETDCNLNRQRITFSTVIGTADGEHNHVFLNQPLCHMYREFTGKIYGL